MSDINSTGFFKDGDALYRVIDDDSDGGLKGEVFRDGRFVPTKLSVAEIEWEGMRVSEAEAKTLMK